MKDNLIVLLATVVIIALFAIAGLHIYLSETSEYSRASDAPPASTKTADE